MSFTRFISCVRTAIIKKENSFNNEDVVVNISALDRVSTFLYTNAIVVLLIILLLPIEWYLELAITAFTVLLIPLIGYYISYTKIKK